MPEQANADPHVGYRHRADCNRHAAHRTAMQGAVGGLERGGNALLQALRQPFAALACRVPGRRDSAVFWLLVQELLRPKAIEEP